MWCPKSKEFSLKCLTKTSILYTVPLLQKVLSKMTLEELKRVASKIDLHFAELPEADSELQRHKIINSLEKALANLGFPQAYVKQLSKPDEVPMIKSFLSLHRRQSSEQAKEKSFATPKTWFSSARKK